MASTSSQLSKTERDMLDLVTKNFSKVTLVYNGANAFQFDFLSNYPQIKSVLWCPPAGQTASPHSVTCSLAKPTRPARLPTRSSRI